MTASSRTIANAPWMRLVALVLAFALAFAGWFVWRNAEARRDAAATPADSLTALETPQAVSACLERRSSEINALLNEGLMDSDAAELSLARARSLCVQRN